MDIQSLLVAEEQAKALAQEEQNRAHDPDEGQQTLNVIGEEEVKKAMETLLKYKQEKANLEKLSVFTGSMDGVISSYTLESFAEMIRAVTIVSSQVATDFGHAHLLNKGLSDQQIVMKRIHEMLDSESDGSEDW